MNEIKNAWDLMEAHAREKSGESADWRVFESEHVCPEPSVQYLVVTGAVPTGTYKSGPRKGQVKWSKEAVATARNVYLKPDEMDAWKAAWSKRTGLCLACVGQGQKVKSASVKDGTTYFECPVCKGTGKGEGR